jgi:hypothetical protein
MANRTRSTPPPCIEGGIGASGIPITQGRLTVPPAALGFAGKDLTTSRRLDETRCVIADSASVRGLSVGKVPRNPMGDPSRIAATGKAVAHSAGFIRLRLFARTRCTHYGWQIWSAKSSHSGGLDLPQASYQTIRTASRVQCSVNSRG